MSIYGIDEAIKRMVGRKLSTVVLNKSRGRIVFKFADGCSQTFGVEGDCCSCSWIEHLEMPGNIDGATLLSVDDSGPITSDHDEHDGEGPEFIQVYNTRFATDRGEIVLEFRNSSNGYYGGSLTDEGWEEVTRDRAG
jgi:hypothetical protein